jgi:hypothetical protein
MTTKSLNNFCTRRRYTMIKLSMLVLGALAVLAVAAGLSGGDASAQSGDARLRVLHASPDAPAVDVYLDGSEAVGDLAFGSVTDYVPVPAGAHAVQVFPSSANGSGTPVIDVPTLTLDAGKDYTVAAVGKLADIEPLVLVDNNGAPAAGNAHIRVVHASPDAPNVDIFAAGAGVVVPDLAFKEASAYLPLPAGSYDLEVRGAGSQTAVLSLPDTQLDAGKVYTAFAIGLAAGDPALSVKLTTDAVAQQAAQATPTPAPSTPAPTAAAGASPAPVSPAQVPTTGGAPGSEGSTSALWLIIGGLTIAAAATTGLAFARRTVNNK